MTRRAPQLFAAAAQAWALNLAARLTMDWFPSEERDLATTAATMANVAGQMAFSLLPPLVVRTPAELGRIMLLQLPPGLAATAAAWLLLEERPPRAPSASAALQWREREAVAASAKGRAVGSAGLEEMLRDMRTLLANGNFVCLATGFSVGTGTVWAVLILEGQLITPCGYSDALAGLAGAALLGTGVASAFAVGAVMESTKAYLPLQRGVMAAAVAGTAGVLAAARRGHAAALIGAYCLLGAVLQPLMPLTLEHAAELTFPLSADVSTSMLFMFANTFATLLVLILTPLLALPVSAQCTTVFTPAAGTILALMAVGLAFTLAVKQDYRRSGCEHPHARAPSPESPLLGGAAAGAGGAAGVHAAYGTASTTRAEAVGNA